ncbi:hypothetical protein M758_UG084100 [Ceratodon purpureus]|nr:hypothetical protein M758_UG084100 [Ceratodon purpureus]
MSTSEWSDSKLGSSPTPELAKSSQRRMAQTPRTHPRCMLPPTSVTHTQHPPSAPLLSTHPAPNPELSLVSNQVSSQNAQFSPKWLPVPCQIESTELLEDIEYTLDVHLMVGHVVAMSSHRNDAKLEMGQFGT